MRRSICLVLASTSLLAACRASEAITGTETMSLLESGSEKTCAAEDVEQTLKEMIEPDAEKEISGSPAARENGSKSVRIEFRYTMQDAFDPNIKKMKCVTEVEMSNGTSTASSRLEYTVSPDAKDAEHFVVWASVVRPRTQARLLAQAIADRVTYAEQREAQHQEQRAAAERLTTMVKPSWLVGWWLESGGGYRGNCLEAGVEYRSDGTFSKGSATGTWQLNGREITRTFDEEHFNLPLPLESTIISADENELGERYPNGGSSFYDRCSEDVIARLRS